MRPSPGYAIAKSGVIDHATASTTNAEAIIAYLNRRNTAALAKLPEAVVWEIFETVSARDGAEVVEVELSRLSGV